MFIRFLEFTVKPGKKVELLKKIKEEILPVLKKYNGFFDLLPWEVESDPTKYFAVSLWYEKKDAERYEKEYFAKVKQIVEPFLTAPVIVKSGPVETAIPEKIFVNATV
jgi:heme-degrading monooxygenase HmoA